MTQQEDRVRSIEEMVEALRKHTRLLREYCRKAFAESDTAYGGEVAGKLRLLATRSRANTPLLIRLFKETAIEPKITMDGPPIPLEPGGPILAGQKLSLEEFMNLPAMGVRVPSGSFITLNKEQFVRAWAEQTGAPHEDWTMGEALSTILSMKIYIFGLQGAYAELNGTASTVLTVAEQFLGEYENQIRA